MSVAGLSHFQDFSPFGPASRLDFQPADPSLAISPDAMPKTSHDSPGSARQLSVSWAQNSAMWGSTSSCESPDRSPQQQTHAVHAQRSSGGSSPTAVSVGAAAAPPASSSAPFPSYNLQQPSVGFYRREAIGGLGPAVAAMSRPPDHMPDAAGFNLNKSITKRMANATHYQQVLDIIADSASYFDEVRQHANFSIIYKEGAGF